MNGDSKLRALLGALQVFDPGNVFFSEPISVTPDDEGTEEFFRGRDPFSLTASETLTRAPALWFFAPKSFVYFLYPFLRELVLSNGSNEVIAGHLLAQFPTNECARSQRSHAILTLLSLKQLKVLEEVVQLINDFFEDEQTISVSHQIQDHIRMRTLTNE